jgi:hypothetical protein
MFGVKLACRFGMMLCMQVVTMGRVSVLRGRGDIFALVVLRGLAVMMCRLLVMHPRFFVMFGDLIRMGHGMLFRINADVRTVCPRSERIDRLLPHR